MAEKESFVNEASRRFYNHFKSFIEQGREQRDRFYAAFDLTGRSNPHVFLSQLKQGKRSVTVEQLYKARDEFGLNPGWLFEVNEVETMGYAQHVLEEPAAGYGNREGNRDTGKKLHDVLKKHKVKIEQYAGERLGISKQAFYDKLKGDSRIYFDEVLQVCEDMGESLDQFRKAPLPKGHALAQIELLTKLNAHLEEEVAQLRKEMKKRK